MSNRPTLSRKPKSAGPAFPARIHTVAEITQISAATLRAWERRYGIPHPSRTDSHYRLYSADDVAVIQEMKALCDSGVAPVDAAKRVLQSRAGIASPQTIDPYADARERILAAALQLSARKLDAELLHLSWAAEPIVLFQRVLEPLLVEVGEKWERGELSVAVEHFLSERVENLLRASLRAMGRPGEDVALLACVEGEHHVLGLLGLALKLGQMGIHAEVLGANTPPSAIEHAVATLSPIFVGLSCSIAPASPQKMVEAYGRACGKTHWMIGGAAAELFAPLMARTGGIVATEAWPRTARSWARDA